MVQTTLSILGTFTNSYSPDQSSERTNTIAIILYPFISDYCDHVIKIYYLLFLHLLLIPLRSAASLNFFSC